jgi:hypothetical protein
MSTRGKSEKSALRGLANPHTGFNRHNQAAWKKSLGTWHGLPTARVPSQVSTTGLRVAIRTIPHMTSELKEHCAGTIGYVIPQFWKISAEWIVSVPDKKHTTSPLRAPKVNANYFLSPQYINIIITLLDIIHRTVFYLKHNDE